MAATERHIRRRAEPATPRQRVVGDPVPGAVVDLRSVSKKYPSGDMGLEDATFAIHPGEFVFLVGATGSGKSTIMRLLIKEIEPSYGSIAVAGRDLAEITRKKIPYYRRNLGVVFQDFKLLPNRTVYDNVAYALQVTGGTRREVREKVPDILRLTGLSTKLHNYPDQLSGGEQQRVSVARAFVNHPPLLLADEPTGNLDPETSVGIMQLLYRINRTGTTVVVATHDKAMVDRMRRRVIEVSEGRVVRDERVGGYSAERDARGEFGALWRRGARVRFGFFLREALRALRRNAVPVVRGGRHGARHGARARRLHPRRAGHDRRGQRDPREGARRRLPQDRRRRRPTSARVRRASRATTPGVGGVEFVSKQEAIKRRARGGPRRLLRPARHQPAARPAARHARAPGGHRAGPRRARAGLALGRAHRDRQRRSTRSRTARRTRTRSSPPRAS